MNAKKKLNTLFLRKNMYTGRIQMDWYCEALKQEMNFNVEGKNILV